MKDRGWVISVILPAVALVPAFRLTKLFQKSLQ